MQGEAFASRLRAIAESAGCDWRRLRPPAEDWNDALRNKENQKKEDGKKRMKTCRIPVAGVKGGCARPKPAHDLSDRDGGFTGEVMKD